MSAHVDFRAFAAPYTAWLGSRAERSCSSSLVFYHCFRSTSGHRGASGDSGIEYPPSRRYSPQIRRTQLIEKHQLGAELAHRYRAELDEVAAGITKWLADWHGSLPPDDHRREYWDNYQPSFVNNIPQWNMDGSTDVAALVLDRAMGYLSGHPAPVVMANLRTVIRIVLVRPDLACGNFMRESLVFRLQFLLQDAIQPQGIGRLEWRAALRGALRQFIAVPELREEFKRCAELMESRTDHPKKAGFENAVMVGSRMLGLRRKNRRRVAPLVLLRFQWPAQTGAETVGAVAA